MPKSKNVNKKITNLTMVVLRYPSTGKKEKDKKKGKIFRVHPTMYPAVNPLYPSAI